MHTIFTLPHSFINKFFLELLHLLCVLLELDRASEVWVTRSEVTLLVEHFDTLVVGLENGALEKETERGHLRDRDCSFAIHLRRYERHKMKGRDEETYGFNEAVWSSSAYERDENAHHLPLNGVSGSDDPQPTDYVQSGVGSLENTD